jgi:hypothetical protein
LLGLRRFGRPDRCVSPGCHCTASSQDVALGDPFEHTIIAAIGTGLRGIMQHELVEAQRLVRGHEFVELVNRLDDHFRRRSQNDPAQTCGVPVDRPTRLNELLDLPTN